MLRVLASALAVGMLCVVAGLRSQEKEEKKPTEKNAARSDEAKKLSEQFVKDCFMGVNFKETMMLVGVPAFWVYYTPQGQRDVKIISKMNDLKYEYDIFIHNVKPYKGTLEFVSNDSYERYAAKETLPPDWKKKFDEVLKNHDRVVEWQIKKGDGSREFSTAVVFVAVRDRQARVVGSFVGTKTIPPKVDSK